MVSVSKDKNSLQLSQHTLEKKDLCLTRSRARALAVLDTREQGRWLFHKQPTEGGTLESTEYTAIECHAPDAELAPGGVWVSSPTIYADDANI